MSALDLAKSSVAAFPSRLSRLRQGTFLRQVALLISGTMVAQALAFAFSPVLTRLYDPHAFGVLGLFSTVSIFLTVLSTAAYEMAIVLPKEDEDAAHLLLLTLGVVLATTLAVLLAVPVAGGRVASLAGRSDLARWLWWLPAVVLAGGGYQALNYWSTRFHRFKRLSVSRVFQSVSVIVIQAGAGFCGFLTGGLVVGYVVGQCVSALVLGWQVARQDRRLLSARYRLARIKELAAEHSGFPCYTTPQQLMYQFSQSAVLFVLAHLFSSGAVGLYVLADRVLNVPMGLIGNAVLQVFFPRVTEADRDNPAVVYPLIVRMTLTLLLVCIPAIVVLYAMGPDIFGFFFGERWREAGGMASYLVFNALIGLMGWPCTALVRLYRLQKMHLSMELVRSPAVLVALYCGGQWGGIMSAVLAYSVVGSVSRAFFIWYVIMHTRRRCAPCAG